VGHQADINRFHHALDLFVQASDYEGTPNAVLEAMALETPVVATAAGGTAEILRDGVDGTIVSESTAGTLADAIRCTLGDVAATRTRAAHARRRVETTLSFEERMRTLERIYEELAGRTAPAGGNES
jgi:glycosyltransferase involved in cell wall biosynthesis